MKNDDEVEKSVRETSALVNATADVFRRCFQSYVESIVEDIREYAEQIRKKGRDSDATDKLASLVRDLRETASVVKQHTIQMNRGLKVVNHKNAVHANDHLVVALDRMNRQAASFQKNMNGLAKAKQEKK